MVNFMGARIAIFGAAAAAIGTSMVWAAEPASPPLPGKVEIYKDWAIGCDNVRRCEAVSLWPQDGAAGETSLMTGILRDAGPGGATTVWFRHDEDKTSGKLAVLIDGRVVASTVAKKAEIAFRGPQASALAIGMARGNRMSVQLNGRTLGEISLSGSAAALRYMDAKQERAGTITALVATGPLGVNTVRAAAILPIVTSAPAMAETKLPGLWREELGRALKISDCDGESDGSQEASLYPLSKSRSLVLVPCGAGAYNFSSVPLIATGSPGRRDFEIAKFDYPPGFTENAGQPMLVNAGFDVKTMALSSFAKGRGIGDCGDAETYVWDGSMFRMTEARMMGECRGAWKWITVWRASVRR